MANESQDPLNSPSFSVALRARNHLEAELAVAVLEANGIPAHVPGGLLADEFAVSQRLLNLNAVDVMVPTDRVAEARAALEQARADAATIDEDSLAAQAEAAGPALVAAPGPEPTEPAPHYPWLTVLGLLVASLTFLWLWQEERLNTRRLTNPLVVYEGEVDGTDTWVWAANGAPHSRSTDSDRDGVPEWLTTYNRQGRTLHTLQDSNENGIYEQYVSYAADRGEHVRGFDADEDGLPERIDQHLGNQRKLVTQIDGASSTVIRFELRDAQDRVLRTWVVDADEGLKPQQ